MLCRRYNTLYFHRSLSFRVFNVVSPLSINSIHQEMLSSESNGQSPVSFNSFFVPFELFRNGIVQRLNQTKASWQWGMAEKVRDLIKNFKWGKLVEFSYIFGFGYSESLFLSYIKSVMIISIQACSKYIRALEDIFDLDDSPRFQLVLSTVKQMKVHDMLDNIPDSAPFHQLSITLTTVFFSLRYLL